jgi:hypothetical protein
MGELALKLWNMRKQGQDVKQLVLQMMAQQDQGGAPANAFDLEDKIAALLSDPSKLAIADIIVKKIDTLIAQARAGQIPPDAANIEAINYIHRMIKSTHQRLQQNPNIPKAPRIP